MAEPRNILLTTSVAPLDVGKARCVSHKARVAHLTSAHTAFDVRIFHKECRSLAAAGYEVVLIATHAKAETVDGVRICPVPENGARHHRMTATVWQVYRRALESGASLFHFHDPELLPVGVLLKLNGKRVIYDAHEHLASDILTKHWIPPRIRRLVSAVANLVEACSAATFDGVIGATPAISNTFPKSKSALIQNYPIVGELESNGDSPYGQRLARVLYLGSITEMKGASQMVEAMHRVPERLAAQLLMLGDVEPPELKLELSNLAGWNRVELLGFQNRGKLRDVARCARVGLVLFQPLPNYEDSQPNKLFEYMSAGLPVVASNFSHWRAVIERTGCGLVVDPQKPAEIADAITWLLDHPSEAEAMGRRGQHAVRSTYNWDTQAEKLLDLYERILQ
jgi:glycosyltransferase involved in cell wall biosynthesis